MVKSKVSIDVQLAAFVKHKNLLFEGNRVKPCTDEIFKILSAQLGMTPQAIRLSVVRNATNILIVNCQERKSSSKSVSLSTNEKLIDASITENGEHVVDQSIESEFADSLDNSKLDQSFQYEDKIHKSDESKEILDDEDQSLPPHESDTDETVPDDIDVKVNAGTVSFRVEDKAENIFGISYKKQGGKNRLKAATGWGWTLRNLIWKNFKSQCCWTFRSADPKTSGDIICRGGCKTCKAKIQIVFTVGAAALVEITNYDASVAHQGKKCRLTGAGKRHYSNLLENAYAHTVHISEANRLMEKGDPIPAHLPTTNAMRIIKSRDNAIHGRTTTDVLHALVELKFISKPSVIGDISIHPFYVS